MMNHIYGLVPVLEALRAGRRPIHKILVAAGANPSRLNELTETARRAKITIEKCDRRALDELTRNANHQGVVALLAETSAPAYASAGASVGKSSKKSSGYVEAETILESLGALPLLVLLDGIEDPHNLGAILRTCEGAGVDGVFIPEHRAAGLNETVAKTSAGAVEYVSVARVTNLVRLIEELKEQGIRVVGVEGETQVSYTGTDFNVPLAIVVGSEGKGVRRLVRENCDAIVSIPMHGQINSLNVSVATGIVLFEVLRQRSKSV